MTSEASTPVYLVLSPHGKIFDSTLDEEKAKRRAQQVGGLLVLLTATHDFRADKTVAVESVPQSLSQPFRAVPDVR